jgi:hypothetical protein
MPGHLGKACADDRRVIDYPGYERLMECGEEWLEASQEGPGVTEGALEYPVSMQTSFRDEAALFYDYNLRRLAQTEAMAELHIGWGLNSLKNRLMDCGYARMEDFAREELGISGRLASELMRNAAMLAKLPSLCSAYCSGMVKRTALRQLLNVVTADNEEELIRKASTMTVRETGEMVKAMKRAEGGFEEPKEDPAFMLSVTVPQVIAARFDYAYERFCRIEEADRPLGEFIEALIAEFVAYDPVLIAGKIGAAEKGDADAARRVIRRRGGGSTSDSAAWWEKGYETFLSEEKALSSQYVYDRDVEPVATTAKNYHDARCCSDSPSHRSHGSDYCLDSCRSWGSGHCHGYQGSGHCHGYQGSGDYHGHQGSGDCHGHQGSCSCCGADETDHPLAILAFDDEMARVIHRQEEEWRARQELEAHYRSIKIGCEEESNRWDFLPSYPLYVELSRDMRCASQSSSPEGAFSHINPRDAAPLDVAARLRRLVRLRTTLSLHQGAMLHSFSNHKLARTMLFSSPGHYVKERLGMSRSTAYRRMALDRMIREYPMLGEKVTTGALSLLKAELIGRVFCEGTHRKDEWLIFAETSKVRELSREVEAHRRIAGGTPRMKWSYCPGRARVEAAAEKGESSSVPLCAKLEETGAGREGGVVPLDAKTEEVDAAHEESSVLLTLPLESSLVPLFKKAVALYEAHCLITGHEPSRQHFLAMMVTHFLEVHGEKKATLLYLRILERDGFHCQVPGCTCRRNLHVHHIVFRSRGGSDEEWNLITLCSSHHLQGVHAGRIFIEGKAPEDIVVRLAEGMRAA